MPKHISKVKDIFNTVSARLKVENPEISRKEITLVFQMEYTKYYRIEQIEEYKEYWNASDEQVYKKPCIKQYQYSTAHNKPKKLILPAARAPPQPLRSGARAGCPARP
jgi:hypothetical protein